MRTIKSFIAILGLLVFFVITSAAQAVLASMDGSHVDVQNQNGKIVVLAIGASWLPLSSKQADYTNALAKKYAGKNVAVYFVVTDSSNTKSKNYASDADIRKFAADNKLSVPVLRDSDGAVTLKRFDVDQVPSFVILNKSGARAIEPFGGIDPKYDVTIPISKAIDKIL